MSARQARAQMPRHRRIALATYQRRLVLTGRYGWHSITTHGVRVSFFGTVRNAVERIPGAIYDDAPLTPAEEAQLEDGAPRLS